MILLDGARVDIFKTSLFHFWKAQISDEDKKATITEPRSSANCYQCRH